MSGPGKVIHPSKNSVFQMSLRRGRQLLVWLLIGLLGACSPVPQTPTPAPDPLAPDFQLTALTGDSIALHALRGHWVIINFWATWCIPCREEMPYLQRLADQYGDKVKVLGVNMREQPAEIEAFVTPAHVRYPILLQPDDATLLAYGVRKLPLTVVVAPDGCIARQQFGPLQPKTFEPWLRDRLDAR